MGTRKRPESWDYDDDSYDNYDDDMDDELVDIGDLSKDFYSTEWEDPSASDRRFSTRRKIERRNDLKELFSQFDDWEGYDLGSDW